MRRTALQGTDLARSQCRSLRLRLLRIGAMVTRNTRTVAVRLSGACPDQALFRLPPASSRAREVPGSVGSTAFVRASHTL